MAGADSRMLALTLLLVLSQGCPADSDASVYTVTSRSVTMRWTAYPGASHYAVHAEPQNMPEQQPAFFLFNRDTVIGGLNTLQPNTLYTMRVDAMDDQLNVLSSIGTQVALTAPEIPDIELAYSKQSSSITVEFTEELGATSYILRAQSVVGDFFQETPVPESPGTVQGLLPYTDYTLSVMSVNEGGRSQPSYTSELRTVVEAPELVTLSDTNRTISASWTPVDHAVLYTLSIIKRGAQLAPLVKFNTTHPNITFDDLEPGTVYCIRANAWDEYGRTGDHLSACQITRPPTPDPVEIQGASPTKYGLTVYWGAAQGADVYFAESSTGQNCSRDSSYLYCIISPLDCGKNLSVAVTAKNTAGPSYPADVTDFVTFPCAPDDVWVEEPQPGSCRVAWSPVAMADFYQAYVKRDDGAETRCGSTGAPCSFNCTCGYTFLTSVFAYNPSGSSPQGPVVNYTTVPCCPGNVSVQLVSTETLEITWSQVRGAELYETTAAETGGVIHCNDTAPACALSDLRCDTSYSVVVTPCSELRGCNLTCLPQQHATAPCAPQIHNLTQTSPSSVTVHYTTPNAVGTNYSVSANGHMGSRRCVSQTPACQLTDLPCGAMFEVVAVALSPAGQSLPGFSVPLETAPCCPSSLDVMQVTQAMSNVSWSHGHGARSYVTSLSSPRGHATCHTLDTHCMLGCITCGTNYSVEMEAISSTGHSSVCSFSGFSSNPCCPTNVKLYRMTNSTMRVSWRSAGLPETQSYLVDVYGAGSNYTCAPLQAQSHCDVQGVMCGEVYTVVVAPVASGGTKVSFCSRRMYSVSCSGNNVGMVFYRGRRSVG